MGKENSKLKPTAINELMNETSYSEEEISNWYNRFLVDFPSAHISLEELQKIYANLFPQGDASKFSKHVFRTLDVNHDKTIDFRELICGMSVIHTGSMEQKLKWAFNMYDLDGNGSISKQEMLEILQAIYKMAGTIGKFTDDKVTPEEKVEKIFQNMDEDGNEELSFVEFLTGVKSDNSIVKLLQCSSMVTTKQSSIQ